MSIHSAPYRPAMACECCVFGRGQHAEWCTEGAYWEMQRQKLESGFMTIRRTLTTQEAKELAAALGYRAGMTVEATFEPDETENS